MRSLAVLEPVPDSATTHNFNAMPQLIIEGAGTFDVEEGKRLALAIEECGVDIGHRCGGKARCTTCRVDFHEGEPPIWTRAEYDKLKERGLLGEVRLSCQIVVQGPMHVEPLMRVQEMGWDDPGPALAEQVEPSPAWYPLETMEEERGES